MKIKSLKLFSVVIITLISLIIPNKLVSDDLELMYIKKITTLEEKMAIELGILGKASPDLAIYASREVYTNIRKYIKERNELKFDALKFYNGKLPLPLNNKFKDSDEKTNKVKILMNWPDLDKNL